MEKEWNDANLVNGVARSALERDPGDLQPLRSFLRAGTTADVIEGEHFAPMSRGLARVQTLQVVGKLRCVNDAALKLD